MKSNNKTQVVSKNVVVKGLKEDIEFNIYPLLSNMRQFAQPTYNLFSLFKTQ